MQFALRQPGLLMTVYIMLILPPKLNSIRCYVCGGNSGTPCRDPDTDKAEFAVPQDPVQECNDLINNRGCVKQFVNGVVLLRGCWLDGTNKCLRNGAAEVCTCNKDLCNSAPSSSLLPTVGRWPPWSSVRLVLAAASIHMILHGWAGRVYPL